MGVVINPKSPLGIELARWERHVTGWTPENPINRTLGVHTPSRYPRMLYMAKRRADGIIALGDPRMLAETGDDSFARSCQRIVHSEAEEIEAREQGWREDPKEAIKRIEAKDRLLSDAAAHRAYEDRNMSDAAKAEAAAAEEDTALHVAEIPEKPLAKKRGRPPKAAQA